MNAGDIIKALTDGGACVEDYVLIGRDGERLSIFARHSERGVANLLVEDESAERAYVAFLKSRGARRYSTVKEFANTIGPSGNHER